MADNVKIRCPNLLCRMILVVPGDMRGQRVRCAGCGEILCVPKAPEKPATVERPVEPERSGGRRR